TTTATKASEPAITTVVTVETVVVVTVETMQLPLASCSGYCGAHHATQSGLLPFANTIAQAPQLVKLALFFYNSTQTPRRQVPRRHGQCNGSSADAPGRITASLVPAPREANVRTSAC
ncbi:MAG TPA: hypothetical protein VJ714_07600, partial [Anaerolineae bacterium]|nr:hypothetical protein [Anaerolineae bacterium]